MTGKRVSAKPAEGKFGKVGQGSAAARSSRGQAASEPHNAGLPFDLIDATPGGGTVAAKPRGRSAGRDRSDAGGGLGGGTDTSGGLGGEKDTGERGVEWASLLEMAETVAGSNPSKVGSDRSPSPSFPIQSCFDIPFSVPMGGIFESSKVDRPPGPSSRPLLGLRDTPSYKGSWLEPFQGGL